jgi:hypothetical protein
MNIVIGSYAVRSVDGSIDHEATLGKFAGDLLQFEAEQEQQSAEIGAAVHALFDQFKGARLNMPYLTGEVLRRLSATPENYKALTEKVQGFVRSQSQGETADDGTVERPNSVFIIGKGKGGGVARRADLPKK